MKTRGMLILCRQGMVISLYGILNKPSHTVHTSISALLSQGKPTTSSPVGFGGHPGRAVDGNLNRHWGGASCTHTNLLDKPWWQVDLGSDSHINRVVLVNRQDCCSKYRQDCFSKNNTAARYHNLYYVMHKQQLLLKKP